MSPSKPLPRWLAIPYAAWAYASFLILSLAVVLLTLPVPWQSLRRRMVRRTARLALRACGMRLDVSHLEHLPEKPCVVVANHGSYLDGVALYAALPPKFGFVIKREMSRVPVANLLLRQIGSHYVDRGRGEQGSRDARRIMKHAHTGDAIAFFPEGTFHHVPGLAQFRIGAFVAAARAQLPIVPIAIRGTRHAMPPGSIWPHPGAIAVELTPPLAPPANTDAPGIAAVVNAARSAILSRIDEPDLAPDNRPPG